MVPDYQQAFSASAAPLGELCVGPAENMGCTHDRNNVRPTQEHFLHSVTDRCCAPQSYRLTSGGPWIQSALRLGEDPVKMQNKIFF